MPDALNNRSLSDSVIALDFERLADRIGESRYLLELSNRYAFAPSAVLIRAAEAELLSAVPLEPPVLDLCCGDGYFCSLICPGGVEAGCDLSLPALKKARDLWHYRGVACADVATGIPFANESFQTVVSNSSLEHVNNIDIALQEIARVLRPGGRLYTTFASDLAYEWWPCGRNALDHYLDFQPVFNHFTLEEWERRMVKVGLRVIGHQYYLSKAATRLMMFLDYHFSHVYMTSDRTLARPVVGVMRMLRAALWAKLWQMLFARVRILADGEGGGILIVAERGSVS
jgi:SAM-dependent methyltransferase